MHVLGEGDYFLSFPEEEVLKGVGDVAFDLLVLVDLPTAPFLVGLVHPTLVEVLPLPHDPSRLPLLVPDLNQIVRASRQYK